MKQETLKKIKAVKISAIVADLIIAIIIAAICVYHSVSWFWCAMLVLGFAVLVQAVRDSLIEQLEFLDKNC